VVLRMPFSDEFKKVLRKNRRQFGFNNGTAKAFKLAKQFRIEPFRIRKLKVARFKKVKTKREDVLGLIKEYS